jgi:sporulation protein YlmC with PRC-barrel domain/ribosomal protein S18 acetylase RimI-like enzyme
VFKSSKFIIISRVIGKNIIDRYSHPLGKIIDLIFNYQDSKIDYVITDSNIYIPASLISEESFEKSHYRVSEMKQRLEIAKDNFQLQENQFSFQLLKKIDIYDISGEVIGKISDILLQLMKPSSLLIGSKSFLNIFSSKDYYLFSITNIGQIKKEFITIAQNKDDLQITDTTGFETVLSEDQNKVKNGKKKYLILEAPINTIMFFLDQKEENPSRVETDLFICELSMANKEINHFVELFNVVLMSSPDNYIPMIPENVKKYFKKGSFVGYRYGKMISYCNTLIEKKENKITGCIAGIGVHPSNRGKGISLAMAKKTVEYFAEINDIESIQADVYENNIPSLNLFSSLGFKEVGITYL